MKLPLKSTDTVAPNPRSSPKWYRVYYLLAAFDVMIVMLGLFLNHQIVSTYNRSVIVNQEWVQRLKNFSELGQLAAAVNAPGNDIFDSHDVESESLKMRGALRVFNERITQVDEELRRDLAKKDARLIQKDEAELQPKLEEVKSAMNEMTGEAESIFTYFSQNQPELAGRRMATMDRKYANLNTSVANLRDKVNLIQYSLLDNQARTAASLQRFEYLIAFFVLTMIGAATLYGRKIKNKMESDERQKNQYINELQDAKATLLDAQTELERRVDERTAELAEANTGLQTEISERKKTDDALRESEERFQFVSRATNDTIWDWTLTTDEFWRSEGFQAMFGYESEEIGGNIESWTSRLHADDLERVGHGIHEVIDNGGQTWADEYRFRRRDGNYAIVADRGYVVRNAKGEAVRMLGSMLDITERKQLEEKLEREREFLAAVLENVTDGIVACDADGNLTVFNRATREFHGLPLEAILADQWAEHFDLYLPDGKTLMPMEQIPLLRALREGAVSDVELIIAPKNATPRSMIVSGQAIFDARGDKCGAVIVMRDITERNIIEATNSRLTNIVESSTDFVCIADTQSCLTYINSAGRKMIGIGEDEDVSGITILDIHPEWVHPTILNEILPNLVQKGAWKGDTALVGRDGLEMPVSLSCITHKTSTGEVEYFSAFMRDITASKNLEAELRRARDAALESARLKSEFLANMSHEIRTPMNGIIGMTGLLLDTELEEEQRDFAQTVRSSADSLLTIINDILDFSKIEAGKLTFENIEFDLRNTVELAVSMLAEQAQNKNIELASLIESDVPTLVCGDAGRLRQVLLNLTGNAVKFTQHGEVIVRAAKENETETHVTVRFSVRDTGIGIAPEARKKLFQAFVQADGSTTRKYGGTGLGLAISKQIVEQMGGEIDIESKPGEGSTFWFTVCLEKQSAAAVAAAFAPRADLRGLRVLIVDDNPTNRKILNHQTESWGMNPVEAENGAVALELLHRSIENGAAFDVALLDFNMPGMDGFELARAIKQDEKLSNLRLVLMPSFGHRGDGQSAREIGIAAYLMKPVKQSQLFDCLATVMGEGGEERGATHSLVTRHSLEESKFAAHTRILIAEDNPVNQKVSQRQVENLGYRADVVKNGLEALEALSKIPYDIVLMDCQMPLMDGYEATAEIRRRENGNDKRIVIIAMTANALEGESEKCLAAGMDDYISKPVDVEELQRILNRWQVSAEIAETSSNGNANSPVEQVSPPVDVERLRDVSSDDEELMRELIQIYLGQMSENIEKLKAAVEANNPDELKRIAHTSIGSSATCGMDAVVPLLRELEQTDYANLSLDALPVIIQVEEQFEHIKAFLRKSL